MNIDCFFNEKCNVSDYECTFVYDNEKILADSCFSNLRGYSYCEKDGAVYHNVEYNCIEIKKREVEGLGIARIFSILLMFFLINFLFLFLIKKIFFKIRYGK
ncbi:MAG: hypothetical protein HFH08_05830 [Bacilli bacterium]|nr:hypothetical protein [Bacilli bacterium]